MFGCVGVHAPWTTKATCWPEYSWPRWNVEWVQWADLVALVSPYLPEGKRGCAPFSPETMLRIHFMQQWFALSDPSMEEALH